MASYAEACTLLTPPAPAPVCYNLAEVEKHFGVQYTPEQRAALKDIPFSEDVLKACAGTNMLFPGFEFSLLDVRAKQPGLFYSDTGGWYENEPFAKEELVRASWHLLRMEAVPGSFYQTWYEQRKLLGPGEETPSAALVAFATMLHFKATGQRLFESCYVRTSDVVSDDSRVLIGRFGADGFRVRSHWDGVRYGLLGLSSARKF